MSNNDTKFEYLLNCGFGESDLVVCHHPTVVLKQAYTYTAIKKHKEWNLVSGLTVEQTSTHRWNLTKTLIIMEGMTPLIKSWYLNLPAAIQDLPLCRTDYYHGGTIMDTFLASFRFPTLERHYRIVLENMKQESVPMLSGIELMHDLLARAFKVDAIFGAVPTLNFQLYVHAVIDAYRGQAQTIKENLIDYIPQCREDWRRFFTYLRTTITNRGLYSDILFGGVDEEDSREDTSEKKSKPPTKIDWGKKKRKEFPENKGSYSPKFKKKPHVEFGETTHMTPTVQSRGSDHDDYEYEDENDEDHSP